MATVYPFFAIFVISYSANMKYTFAGILVFVLSTPIFGNPNIDSLLQVLDQTIAQSEVFENNKKPNQQHKKELSQSSLNR